MAISIRDLRQRAASLLRGHWQTGLWVTVRRNGRVTAEWNPEYLGSDVSSLREFLDRHDMVGPNGLKDSEAARCEMCAEGAVFLAAALEEDATDQDVEKTFESMRKHAGIPDIPGLNDNAEDEQKVLSRLFDY